MNPITREESLLDGQDLTPITRKEQFIKRIYDKTQEVPTPVTREEWFLKKAGEGTSPVTIEQLNVTENGTYSEAGKAYSPVIVEVPAPTLKTKTITENGTYNASSDNADGYSQVTVAVEGFKKKSIANTPTDIASSDDGTANPMPSLEISIEPVQSGSGDPSPSNVRPISGWSGANVTRCGKNLFDGSPYSAWYIANDYAVLQNHLPKDAKLIMSFIDRDTSVDISGCYLGFIERGVTRNPSASQYKWIINNGVGSAGTNTPAFYPNKILSDLVIYPKTQETYDKIFTRFYIQIELGSTATTYTQYQGSTISIPFRDSSDNPITVYGGRMNVTSGELTVTHANIASYNGETINEPWISSMDVYSAGATPTTGAQVVYPLATPQTYQLTPAQVSTLLGQNNIFADCGQILEGEYFVTL